MSKPLKCMECKREFSYATEVKLVPSNKLSRSLPSKGDFNICKHCGNVSIFDTDKDSDLILREPTLAELEILKRTLNENNNKKRDS